MDSNRSATVVQIHQDLQRVLDDRVRSLAFEINDKANAAGLVLEARVVQPLRPGRLGPGFSRVAFAVCTALHLSGELGFQYLIV